MDKIIMQIFKNQLHILYILGQMYSSGNISPSTYGRDKISDELQKETYNLIETLKGESDE